MTTKFVAYRFKELVWTKTNWDGKALDRPTIIAPCGTNDIVAIGNYVSADNLARYAISRNKKIGLAEQGYKYIVVYEYETDRYGTDRVVNTIGLAQYLGLTRE